MNRKQWFLTAGLTALVMLPCVAYAGAPMGPPMALLDEGQWAVGAEFGYKQTDLEACGIVEQSIGGAPLPPAAEILAITDLKTNMIFGSLAYGICDNWDFFVRAGAADAQDDVTLGGSSGSDPGEQFSLDGSYGFAWGVGTRATFCRSGPWSFGGLVQVTWVDPGDSDIRSVDPAVPTIVSVGTADIDYWQTQVGLAAAYQMDSLHLWVGPLLQFVEGDLKRRGDIFDAGTNIGRFSGESDIRETSQFGVHFGVNCELSSTWNLWAEGQWTRDSWLVGIGTGVAIP